MTKYFHMGKLPTSKKVHHDGVIEQLNEIGWSKKPHEAEIRNQLEALRQRISYQEYNQ